uniref:Protein kinase domain-containing protein n=1 Tax=Ganoderma boninense TaxID=34458 RepID=A0A5K1K1M2_9APHY|nr:Protein kinase domain-containing protein [Ganoderma boninense]
MQPVSDTPILAGLSLLYPHRPKGAESTPSLPNSHPVPQVTTNMYAQLDTPFDNTFNIDLLTECEDEYWAHADPELKFKPAVPEPVANLHANYHQLQIAVHRPHPVPLHTRPTAGDLLLPHLSPTRATNMKVTQTARYHTFAGNRCMTKDHEGAHLKDAPSLAAATFTQPLPHPPSTHPHPGATPSDSEKQVVMMGSLSFALTMHTDEIGRLPLHPGFNGGSSGEWQSSQ